MSAPSRKDSSRHIRAPRGTTLSCKSWLTEAAYRMIQNNLDAEVAENPQELVVYGGIGRAARDWASYDKILETLRTLEDDQTLLIQSGKPVGVFPSHPDAPACPTEEYRKATTAMANTNSTRYSDCMPVSPGLEGV